MKKTRIGVFETNSSSSHSVSFGNEKPQYLNWKLEDYAARHLEFSNNPSDPVHAILFDPDYIQGRTLTSSGDKLTWLISVFGRLLDYYTLKFFPEKFHDNKMDSITREEVFGMNFFKWLWEICYNHDKLKVMLEFNGNDKYFPWIQFDYYDNSPREIFENMLRDLKKLVPDLEYTDCFDFFTNNEERFKKSITEFLFNENFIIIDEYEEW